GKARSGSKALQLLQSTSPDIVLLDINLDGSISGIEVAKTIKRKYAIPFVYLTALADTSTLEEVKSTMPYGYIVKPFNENDLRSTIELAIYRYQSQQKADDPPSLQAINKQLISPLSQREYEILLLFRKGLTYKEMGKQLYIGHNTVKTYQKSLFAKLDVGSRHQLTEKLKKLAR
ncbi:MAG: response regulator transcription factor, partial [Bacteroidota bacterium]